MKKICVLVCAVIVTIAPAQGQGKRFITEKDLLKFTWIADPQISPDGSTVAFVRVTVNEKENKYESSLFAVLVVERIGSAETTDLRHARHGAAVGAGRQEDRLRASA